MCIPHNQRARRPVGDATRQCLAQNGALPHHISRVGSFPSTFVVLLAARACQGSPDEGSLNSVNKVLFLSFTAATHSSRSGLVVRQAKRIVSFRGLHASSLNISTLWQAWPSAMASPPTEVDRGVSLCHAPAAVIASTHRHCEAHLWICNFATVLVNSLLHRTKQLPRLGELAWAGRMFASGDYSA